MTSRHEKHIEELQRDLNDLRSAYADVAQQQAKLKKTLDEEKADAIYYKTLAHKLSEKLDMMETAVCNLVSMMFRK